MSSRNFRKVVGKPFLPEVDDSDEEYEPLYVQKSGNSKYAGLAVSSHSESEHDPSPEKSEDDLQDYAAALPKKKNFRKKGKGKGKKPVEDLDEIERSVKEVNAILGAPSPAPVPKPPKTNQAYDILTPDPKHLNVANELRKLFGPEEANHTRRARVQPNRVLLLKRVLIHPNKDTAVYDFHNSGLSMTKYREEDNRMYFVFIHDEHYQKMHRTFLKNYATKQHGAIVMLLNEARQNMHVELLLEISDRLFRMEEHGVANEIVENVVTFLQYAAHPLFILSQNNVRLEYKFMENRPFHVAMLKYVYLLSNKACHRTALEITKMLLLIDPADPLAMLMVLDVMALRAREHEWLIDAIKYFDRQREATLLYNIKYSFALAHFHVAVKNKRDLAEANKLIQEGFMAHPQLLVKILECCNVSKPSFLSHEFFKTENNEIWSSGCEELFMIYAKMTAPRWNEPPVMSWLLKNAAELCANYDNDPKIKTAAEEWATLRYGLFQVWPPEYLRHMSVIRSMSNLIFDAPLTAFHRPTCAWDPLFDRSINRYNYSYAVDPPRNVGVSRNPVYSLDIRDEFFIFVAQVSKNPLFQLLTPDEIDEFANQPQDAQYFVLPFCLDASDDEEEESESYDYEDDEERFAEYDEFMEGAMQSSLNLEDDPPNDTSQSQQPAPGE